MKYYGNGNTTGIEPMQKAVNQNTSITVKKQGTLKKKGYKFAGWASKATARKADNKLAPGKKIVATKKIQLYAVWKR
ncbi:InlB B-repeat-containing protein [Kurthia sibirica]|uniref:Bacterial repeat domain-containing protein n=1 Tax=Kurthia sibirica TaxID=202750 RepID=A0A2U3ALH8_9BACL|nr:InlB B-repeat-containing protein [Kurthia sibirica]PWI25401.1 hypothetical protein DEX24_08670 [Kurthia sibirica]GEK34364.1 hypothetical protein KSI01_18970 [Kurthia sibirica]